MIKKISNYFKIKERNSTILKEIIGGLVIFFSMVYVLPLNASWLQEVGINYNTAFFFIVVISSIVTICFGIFTNSPAVIAPGLGLSAFFIFTMIKANGYRFDQALCIVIIANIIFVILSITGIRQIILKSIPSNIKYSISTGIGAYLAFIGLTKTGLIVTDPTGLIKLTTSLNPTTILSLLGIVLVFALYCCTKKIKSFSIIITIIVIMIISLILGLFGYGELPELGSFLSFKDIGFISFKNGFDVFLQPQSYAFLFAFVFISLIETSGAIISTNSLAGLTNPDNGEITNIKRIVICDSIGAFLGSTVGVVGMTPYMESSAGINAGARTGLTSVVTGLLFLLSLLIYPILALFTANSAIIGMALVFIGGIMFNNLKNIDWHDQISVFTAFLIILMMVLCNSIIDGFAIGMISYVVMMLFARRGKEINIVMYLLTGLLFIYMIITFIL